MKQRASQRPHQIIALGLALFTSFAPSTPLLADSLAGAAPVRGQPPSGCTLRKSQTTEQPQAQSGLEELLKDTGRAARAWLNTPPIPATSPLSITPARLEPSRRTGLEERRSAADTARFALPPAPQIPAALALPAGFPLNQDAVVERLRQAMEDRGLHHAMALAALEQTRYLEAQRQFVKAGLAWHDAQTALRQQRQSWANHLWVRGPLANILDQIEQFLGSARYAAQSGAGFAAQQGRRLAAGLEEKRFDYNSGTPLRDAETLASLPDGSILGLNSSGAFSYYRINSKLWDAIGLPGLPKTLVGVFLQPLDRRGHEDGAPVQRSANEVMTAEPHLLETPPSHLAPPAWHASGLEENLASRLADGMGTPAALDTLAQAVARDAMARKVGQAWEAARETIAALPKPFLLGKRKLLFMAPTATLAPLAMMMRGLDVLVGADDAMAQQLRALLDSLSLPQEKCTFLSPDHARQLAQAANRPDSDVIPIENEAHLLAIFGLANTSWPAPVAAAIPLTHRYLAAQAGLESGA